MGEPRSAIRPGATSLLSLLALGLMLLGVSALIATLGATVGATVGADSGPSPCTGDCNGDGRVSVDELVLGINIALGIEPISACPAFDQNGDQVVTVDELVAAVAIALNGCPPTATPTLGATATSSATASATPTVTATPTPTPINTPPVIVDMGVYAGFPGYAIRRPIAASDPDGDHLHYAASLLPDGAVLDAATGVLSWTPSADQLGPAYVQFTSTDDGTPPLSVQGLLAFEVAPLDPCTIPTCDPASGCTSALLPIQTNCCTQAPVRVAVPVVGCPDDRALHIGRNNTGFGRLFNCDQLQVVNFQQSGASVRFHVQARCVNTQQPVSVHARLEIGGRLLFDQSQFVFLVPQLNGYAERLSVTFPVLGPGPFFSFEGAEAVLTVDLKDVDGAEAHAQLRVRLTFAALGDLPDLPDVPPPPS